MLEINFIVSDKYKLIDRYKMIRLLCSCFLFSVILFSCSKDEDETNGVDEIEEVKSLLDFDVKVEGEAPKAKLIIENKSVGAKSYEWTFGDGANMLNAVGEKPLGLEVDKAGSFEIKLIAEIDSKKVELVKTFDIKGYNAVISYKDLMFGMPILLKDRKFGRGFSFETGLVYEIDGTNEINAAIKASIEIRLRTLSGLGYRFVDGKSDGSGIPYITFDNAVPESVFSAKMFDDVESDKLLVDLKVINSNEYITDDVFPRIIMFKRKNGQKGIIKIKSINSEKVVVDIKIQKY